MSIELINRITAKKDGVYLSTHSNNDNAPYHSVRNERLSKAYADGGQYGLDKEIGNFISYSMLRGNHPSVKRYLYAVEDAEFQNLLDEIFDTDMSFLDKRYESSVTEKETRKHHKWKEENTEKLMCIFADKCKEYDDNLKRANKNEINSENKKIKAIYDLISNALNERPATEDCDKSIQCVYNCMTELQNFIEDAYPEISLQV